jgi:ketosteroid isomerase-like protein
MKGNFREMNLQLFQNLLKRDLNKMSKAKANRKNWSIKLMLRLLLVCFLILTTTLVQGNIPTTQEDKLIFEKLFSEWANAFDKKDLAKVCALFSKDIVATYYVSPEKEKGQAISSIVDDDKTNKNKPLSSVKQHPAKGGVLQKDYAGLCNGFKKLLSEENKHYQYRFEIHQVYRSLDLAVVRITWYLTIDEPGKKTALIQDEGLDILQQDGDKHWKIVNFMGFGGS